MISPFLQKNRIAVACIICVVYLLLTIFYYHIERYLNWIAVLSSWLLIALSFALIIAKGFMELFRIFQMWRNLTLHYTIPAIIYTLTIIYIFCPIKLSSAPAEENVVLRACFEGTQNEATLKFYKDGNFVLHWTGVFFYSKYFSGTYENVSDTFLLDYKTEKPFRFGRKILNKDGLFRTLDSPTELGQYNPTFYLGYCKGLN